MARTFVCTFDDPVVETKQGKIRGYIIDGTYTFHGIKYADAKRFQPPMEPASWEGVKDAHSYGYVCPMLNRETAQGEILAPHRYWPKDENCQYLNIWTQSIDREAKKPVMVWFHGGGYSDGSSIEQAAYDGENLSKFGDVVVVTVNHRLNILGYLDLSPYGEKYKNSGNAGNADLVASLKWVRDNIAGFGGDPENVTIFGQSGGGGKVYTLMQTPEADGLFHKGIIMSGVGDGFPEQGTDSRPLVDAMLLELGLAPEEIENLETVPYEDLAAAYKKVVPAIRAAGGYTGCAPIPNGWYKGDPRKVGFTEHAKTIPVIIGTVISEFGAHGLRGKREMTEAEQMKLLKEEFGSDAETIAALFKAAHPTKCVTDVLMLDSFSRVGSKDFACKKAAVSKVPTYNYLFTLEFPLDEGTPAWHCSDIPFFFHNTDKVALTGIPGVADELERKMSGAFVNFARSGDPDVEGLPHWTPVTADVVSTMIFDRECTVRANFDDALYKAFAPYAPNPFAPKKKTFVPH